MVILIVYIGAVAVLFLFVVMMLDINVAKLRQGFLNYLPTGLLVGFIILFLVIWDCLIFIVKKTGELLWLKKQ